MTRADLRPAEPADEPFLEGLVRLAAGWRDGTSSPLTPQSEKYVRGWGRSGDYGVVALLDGARVGAAWYRLFQAQDRAYGYVRDDVPELTVAVERQARGIGLASSLLTRLLADAAAQGVPAVSLSVEPENPARVLYERLGFVKVAELAGAWTMWRPTSAERGSATRPHEPLLTADRLTLADLPAVKWSGGPSHLKAVAAALRRGREVDYLALRDGAGAPVAIGGIDYVKTPDAGVMWQLCTHPELRGRGLGTRLMRAMEDRIRSRNLQWAILGVEDDNPRARSLYERLGYREFRRSNESWEVTMDDGTVALYETEVAQLRKQL